MITFKKSQLVLLVAFVSFHIGFAQEDNKNPQMTNETAVTPIKIGAKVGYSLGNLTSTETNIYTEDYESTSGIDFGLTAEFELTKLISIQTELNYTSRGGERNGMQPVTGNALTEELNMFLPFLGQPTIENDNPLYAEFDSESKLKYLEVPVLAKFGWGDDFRFYGEIGPYVGILLSAKQETSGTSKFYYDAEGMQPVHIPLDGDLGNLVELPAQSIDADTNTKDDLKTVNFGGIVGIGIIKSISDKSEVYFDARGAYSFNSIQIKDDFGKSHIGGVIFSLGYAYQIQ